jgi:exopolysaccharide production protein ExoY
VNIELTVKHFKKFAVNRIPDSPLLYIHTKRGADLFIAVSMLLIFSPFILLSLLIIFWETKENPIFIQERALTLLNKRFKVYKIRTLKTSIHPALTTEHNVFSKPKLAFAVTRFGSFLRKTGLDELPQLINVIIGNMSLIGPRPLSVHDLRILSKNNKDVYERREKLNILPGISGYWQLYGCREEGLLNLIELDEYYNLNKSFLFDFSLIIKTLPVIILGKHSDAIKI